MVNDTATDKDPTPIQKQGDADILKRLKHLEKENAEGNAYVQHKEKR
jgi:hypothetical protein